MTTVDLDALVLALDPEGRGGRHDIDTFATELGKLAPGAEPADVPDLVRVTLERGREAGLWSVAKATVRRGRSALPKSIQLIRTVPPGDQRRPVGVPLRPELAGWATSLDLLHTQRTVLLAVNDWLRRTNGGRVAVIPAAERAYEVLGNEKAFDSTPPAGGETLWRPGRLTFDLLRCVRVPTPLTWEPAVPVVGPPGALVCVENHATFRSLLRVLRARTTPRWAAVAWIQGRNTAPLASVPELPLRVTRFDYLGDLDAPGLEIAAAACAVVSRFGIPAGPAETLWRLLADRPSRTGTAVEPGRARDLAEWLPEAVRDRSVELLTDGRAIPQEALRFDLIDRAL
ncbi:Uncharacterised protein [Amycolatopsis camponoti]|uniref:Wadjet protein JetD C-terminal domain-containing protein n=1 Tax=Amycolatopsis camponoti TaxID=2606593 RepID=A0A6I8M1Z5_9PSEU|nr:hypothetical protein [Amycolatopsis camponoti]VVJ21616.1 Uncharacterised protein [Amycolatopsis camponoti]